MKRSIATSTILMCSICHIGYCSSESLSLIYSFSASQEGNPHSNIVTPDNGTTFYAHSDFSLYKVDALSQTLTVLQKARQEQNESGYYSFNGNLTLSQDKQFIYGIENSFLHGAIFKLTADGLHKQYLHEFDLNERFEEGYDAVGSLILTKDEHKLYGVTESGGIVHARSKAGVIYQITINDTLNPTYKVLHAFSGKEDGNTPNGKLVLSPDEHYLYGLTSSASAPNYCGTLFRINFKNINNPYFETLRSFNCESDQPRLNSLVISKDGTILYTSTTNGYGSIFKIELNKPNYPITRLHAFARNTQGQHPVDLVLSQDEKTLFGISSGSDTKNYHYHANIFKLSLNDPQPHYSVLHTFDDSTNYHVPHTPLYIALNEHENTLYGISEYGGEYGWGALFQYSLSPMQHL